MPRMLFDMLTIVGVGLLGGSVGAAAIRRRLVRRVIGVGRDEAKLAAARAAGIIHEYTADLAVAAGRSDLIVFCTPVDRIAEQVIAAAAVARSGTILTDVGSTKSSIVEAVLGKLPAGVHFVGSHPMAGSEKKGADHADADLFVGRAAVVTTDDSDSIAAANVIAFWKTLGSRVYVMSPADHDRAVALVSHLPHAVAAALAAVVDPALLPLSAGGFRDTTRIAAAAPAIWEPIFRANRDAVRAALDAFTDHLAEFRRLLDADDGPGLAGWLSEGKRVRDALGS